MNAETTSTPIYLDPERPTAERVADLVGRMTIEEKLGQLVFNAPAIARLGIPAYNWWGEALHGIARNGRATVFPQAIGMAATWDPALIERVASAIGDEGRAKYHATLRRFGETGHYQGLTFWSPNVNIFRDPRWGRGQETWGEDPFLTGELGAAFVRGLQGDDPRYLKAAACAKHYAVHSGPESKRHEFDAQVSRRDLYTTYLPAFKKLVTEAKVEAVMGAYNRTNGEACCASELLLVEILRGEWGFQGHVVSDCWALNDLHTTHGVTRDPAESCGAGRPARLRPGVRPDLRVPGRRAGARAARRKRHRPRRDAHLHHALQAGHVRSRRSRCPTPRSRESVINSAAHRQLAYEAAHKSIVLLKNANAILPLRDLRSLYVIGPTAAIAEVLHGQLLRPVGIADHAHRGHRGAHTEGRAAGIPPGHAAAACAGQPQPVDAHGRLARRRGDRLHGPLAADGGRGGRRDRIAGQRRPHRRSRCRRCRRTICVCSRPTGARLVLVLTGGSAIALGDIADLADAILFVWYPGQEGGRAVADVLFGAVAPSGKLPVTFPKSLDQLPPFEEYSMAGRTYRYATAEPQFPLALA